MSNTNRRKRINSLHFKTIKNWWITEHKKGHSVDLFFISSAQSIETGKVDMEILKTCIKSMALSWLRVKWSQSYLYKLWSQEGVGKSQNKGKGLGGTNVETWKGKCQLEFTQLVMFKSSVRPPSLNCLQNAYWYHSFKKSYTLAIQPPPLNDCLTLPLGKSESHKTLIRTELKTSTAHHVPWYFNKKMVLGWHLGESFSFILL